MSYSLHEPIRYPIADLVARKIKVVPESAGADAIVVRDANDTEDRIRITEDRRWVGYYVQIEDYPAYSRGRLTLGGPDAGIIRAYDPINAVSRRLQFEGALVQVYGTNLWVGERDGARDIGSSTARTRSHYVMNIYAYSLLDVMGYVKKIFPISSGIVSVAAGGTFVVARFTVPTGKTLKIHAIGEVYDPDGYISAEVYNVTDAVSVASVDGFDDTGWEVAEGKTVEFRMVNSDTVAAHDGHYVFLISLV